MLIRPAISLDVSTMGGGGVGNNSAEVTAFSADRLAPRVNNSWGRSVLWNEN